MSIPFLLHRISCFVGFVLMWRFSFVWMVPVWTYDSDEAATGFEIRIQGSGMAGWKDLASGAGGDFRYAYANHDQASAQRVVDAKLIRSGDKLSAEKQVSMLSGLGKGWYVFFSPCLPSLCSSRGRWIVLIVISLGLVALAISMTTAEELSCIWLISSSRLGVAK